MRFDKATMVRVLHDEPKFSEMFLSYVLSRNARIEEDLVDQLFNSTEKRLARVLLLMANFGKDTAPEPVIPKISQETLAEIIGTTRLRVHMFMNKFRQLGFLEYNGDMNSRFIVERRIERLIGDDTNCTVLDSRFFEQCLVQDSPFTSVMLTLTPYWCEAANAYVRIYAARSNLCTFRLRQMRRSDVACAD